MENKQLAAWEVWNPQVVQWALIDFWRQAVRINDRSRVMLGGLFVCGVPTIRIKKCIDPDYAIAYNRNCQVQRHLQIT